MFQQIKDHPILSNFIIEKCEDEGLCIDFDEKVAKEDYLILKPDAYYNSLNIEKKPPSPDCFILLKCKSRGYALTIVEFKDITSTRSGAFELQNILAKYQSCLDDFVSDKFKDILFQDYKKIQLYFISNIEIYKRDLGLKMEALIESRITFNGKKHLIQAHKPSPAIKNCY